MGGNDYGRDVYSSGSSSKGYGYSSGSYSAKAASTLSRSVPTSDMVPSAKGRIICNHENPIVIAFDVTGSMGDAAKIVYDKLPMFWGELVGKKYLPDPSVSFFAVGDILHDRYPLQLCEFAEGIALEDPIKKIYLEGGGGGNQCESYELCAYYYAYCCDMPNAKLPFFFFIGDEGYQKEAGKGNIKQYCDKTYDGDRVKSVDIFDTLKKKFNVFLLHKEYEDSSADRRIVSSWKEVLGPERVRLMKDPKAVVDMMLGIIALLSETRDLDDYVIDMKARGQTNQRIELVTSELSALNNSLVKVDNALSTVATVAATSRATRSKRL